MSQRRLLVDHIDDALAETTYDASLAVLNYSIESSIDGIYVGVAGYNDKLDVLLRIVLEKLRDLIVLPDRLCVLKEKVGFWSNADPRRLFISRTFSCFITLAQACI